jgi:hypothetical protein
MAELGDEGLLFRRSAVLQVDDLRIDGLDISFDVRKSLSPKTPNKAEVRIWNLNPEHRAQLQQLERVYVSLEAGYETAGRSLIFRGDLRRATSAREGSDWITTITSDTGSTARKKRIAKSFAPGSSVADVLQTAAKAMGLRLGNTALKTVAAKIAGTQAAQFFNGYALAGTLGDEVERLARSSGLEWSVQDDELQFLDRGRPLQETGFLLSPETGLVGSAEAGNKGITEARCLLMPDVAPGRRVQVKSAHVNATFRIESTRHRGGRADPDWYIDLELKGEKGGARR